MWVEKHRPKNPHQMVGNEESRLALLDWLKQWKPPGRPVLLLGPPGTGKTTLVHAAAQLLGYTVIELNASDVRTKERLATKVGPLLQTTSLYDEKRLLFLDEVDGIYGRPDYGGMEFVLALVDAGSVPIALAANVENDQKLRKLAAKALVLHFKPIPPRLIELYIKQLFAKEGVTLPGEMLVTLIAKSRGDIRAAINTAQAATATRGVGQLQLDRDASYELSQGLTRFFAAHSREEALHILRSTRGLPREKIRALYSSLITSPLDNTQLVQALEALAKADELVGEIGRTQEWRLLRYFDRLVVDGLFNKLPSGTLRFSEDDLPWNLKIRIWNEARILHQIALQLARLSHASSRRLTDLQLPYFALIVSRRRRELESASRILRLDETAQKVLAKEATRSKERLSRK